MSDNNIDQEQKTTPSYELSETPFGTAVEKEEQEIKAAEVAETSSAPVCEPEVSVEADDFEEPMSMEAAMAAMDEGGSSLLNVGDVVDGIVVHIDHAEVLVDVGQNQRALFYLASLLVIPALVHRMLLL